MADMKGSGKKVITAVKIYVVTYLVAVFFCVVAGLVIGSLQFFFWAIR